MAQRLIVIFTKGKVEAKTPKGQHVLSKNEIVSPNSTLIFGYDSECRVLDEQARKTYKFHTVGTAKVSTLIQNLKSSDILTPSEKYIKFYLGQISGKGSKGSVAATTHITDPATVTRDQEVALEENYGVTLDSLLFFGLFPPPAVAPSAPQRGNSHADVFDTFRDNARREFDTFRRQCADEYANFARLIWEEMDLVAPIPAPTEPTIEPIRNDVVSFDQPIDSKPIEVGSILRFKEWGSTIRDFFKEKVPTHTDRGSDVLRFTLFDTEFTLRYPAAISTKLHLKIVTENHVADVLDVLLNKDYDNLLNDCLQARTDYELCDWAYYQFLKRVGQCVCPTDTNCATVITAYLYAQSGYKMRLGIIDGHVQMFVGTEHIIYNHCSIVLNGESFFSVEPITANGSVIVCPAAFYEEEQPLVLRIMPQPGIGNSKNAQTRTITSKINPDISANISVKDGLLEFYNTYPSSYIENNFMTTWALYANTPMDSEVSRQLYPQLRAAIAGYSKRDAAEQLLFWVQTGFAYDYDNNVWGGERAFFAEETLHYPFCDCEDRAILLTRLVRDLLGLKCVLIYYPGHLACAIHFDEPVDGDYVTLDGEHYIVADPAFIAARLGHTMTGMDNTSATLILLNE